MQFEKNILCIGAGYVGGPTMAVLAQKCPQYRVTVVDINPMRIAEWNSDELPIYEPGLDNIVRARRGRNLFFSTDIPGGIRDNDIIFVSVNTPTKTFGVGAGMSADLQYWEKTARQILQYSLSSKIVIEKSTLPVKTAQAMENILHCTNNSISFDILSNPEFLAEGTAIKDLEHPAIKIRLPPSHFKNCDLVIVFSFAEKSSFFCSIFSKENTVFGFMQ